MSKEQNFPPHRPESHDEQTPEYSHATGGWGSLSGLARHLQRARGTPDAFKLLAKQNKPGGFMCTSCAWAKPAEPHLFEFCESGAKATLWETTPKRCTPEFFSRHTATQLRDWHDHDLEMTGRLTHPMRFDHASDRYVPVSWESAFAEIGRELKSIDPEATAFYSSGHAGLEASYLYALFARVYGHQNLPQSSNMCHETTSVNLQNYLGTPVGTCTLEDFDHCDAIFFFGQNTGSNSPRFLHTLKAAVKRGCKIVTFNPVRERGLIEFVDPQNPIQMTVGNATQISEQYYQVKPGGDVAVLCGIMKHIFEVEENSTQTVLDQEFIAEHTQGFSAMKAAVAAYSWTDIESHSGLSREMISNAAEVYLSSQNVIGIYGMGLTQQVGGWLNLGMLVNLLLLRGNIGRKGAGISPVRGHSNVQGQRTVGVGEKSSHMRCEILEDMFSVKLPRKDGMNAVRACESLLKGDLRAIILLGGNLVRALPDRVRIENAWPKMRLTVYIATKLNRSHITPGEVSFLLPCLGRTDEDLQAGGRQVVTIEDSLSNIYASVGTATPPSEHLHSEVAIIAGIARATLEENPKLCWEGWTADYNEIRNLIETTWPDQFHDFNDRMFKPGGFYKGNAARERKWKTDTGKANFTTPTSLSALGTINGSAGELANFTLITLRSNDQFNTTIYGFSDRLRGLEGSRDILLINRAEMARLGLEQDQKVSLVSAFDDGVERRVDGLSVTAFDLPSGCVAGYYPELNPLVPLSYHEKNSQTPASKGAPVRIEVV